MSLFSLFFTAYPELFPAVSDEDNNANTVNSDIVPDGLETTQPKPCRPSMYKQNY